eukprot:5123602-Karenia_brevis.AAC.1
MQHFGVILAKFPARALFGRPAKSSSTTDGCCDRAKLWHMCSITVNPLQRKLKAGSLMLILL